MAIEIERKFLVRGDAWRDGASGTPFRQGYLATAGKSTVRIRIEGGRAKLTIKGQPRGATRTEYEYGIPLHDAEELLELCERPLIRKIRYRVPHAGLIWEVDEFEGQNEGLVLAEVELKDESQRVDLPDWVGREVTDDPRYYNASLVKRPFRKWRSGV